jgi:hypothetical protein
MEGVEIEEKWKCSCSPKMNPTPNWRIPPVSISMAVPKRAEEGIAAERVKSEP